MIPGRVQGGFTPDGALHADTTNHTPGWALMLIASPVFPIGLILTLAVRKTRHAVITASATPTGSVLHLRGKLDTRAANRIRAMSAAA